MNKFGIVIATCHQDSHFAQASFWAIRHFMGPEMPVCFIVDGDISCLGKVREDSNVSFITRSTVKKPWLRDHCFGWGTTKMLAFFEAPFERFLYLDADAMPMGDITHLGLGDSDMVTDCGNTYSDDDINFWFFDTKAVEKIWPDFDWRAYRNRYFCTGTFFAKRGIFDLENLQEKMGIATQNSSVFNFGGEMGFLNLMIFQAAQKGKLSVESLDYQVIPVDHSDAELREKYSPKNITRMPEAVVLHFCGKKPHIFTSSPKVGVMNYFRMRYLLEAEEIPLAQALLRMARQDWKCVCTPWMKRGIRKATRLTTRLFCKSKAH